MPKKFKIPLRGEHELTKFPWMTNTVTVLSLIFSYAFWGHLNMIWSILVAAAVYLLCLLTMHFNFFRMLYFSLGVAVLVAGFWLGYVYRNETAAILMSALLLVYSAVILSFGYHNFRQTKASL